MKKVLVTALSLGVFAWAGSAVAAPMTWTDTIDFNPDVLVPPTLYYYHNIADDGFSSSWMGGSDTITGFDLTVSIYDDNIGYEKYEFIGWKWFFPVFDWVEYEDGPESAKITYGLETQTYDFSLGEQTFSGNFWGGIDIYHDGTLNVWISSSGGDFYVDKSTLNVFGTSPVPEPATMLLFGAGLAGLAAVSRRRKTE